MTKLEAKNFNKEVQAALAGIFEKYGMTIDRSGLSYGDYEIDLKVKATLKGAGGAKVVSPRTKTLIQWNLGYDKDDVLDRTFQVYNLGECKIVDYNSRCSKYPFVVQTKSGTKYKVSKSSIVVK